ncbi:hypothetical protein ACFVYD_01735 [Streptomyces sp. NPDC058301]|uniref:hypothetical protein n=1 Tax=Streptomyces sp. NPDC058301 TaxID=3346436 RepID=UPI0036E74735
MTEQATTPGQVPDDDLAFTFRSGRLCLSFVATVGERWRGGPSSRPGQAASAGTSGASKTPSSVNSSARPSA